MTFLILMFCMLVLKSSGVLSIPAAVSFNSSLSIQSNPPIGMTVAIFYLPLPPLIEEDVWLSFILASYELSLYPYYDKHENFTFESQIPHLPSFSFMTEYARETCELLWTIHLLARQCLSRRIWRPFKYEVYFDDILFAKGVFSRSLTDMSNVVNGSSIGPESPQAPVTNGPIASYLTKPNPTSRSLVGASRQLTTSSDGNITTNDVSSTAQTNALNEKTDSLPDDNSVRFTYLYLDPAVEFGHDEVFAAALFSILFFAPYDKSQTWDQESRLNFASVSLVTTPVLRRGISSLKNAYLLGAIRFLAMIMYENDDYAAMRVSIASGGNDIGFATLSEKK